MTPEQECGFLRNDNSELNLIIQAAKETLGMTTGTTKDFPAFCVAIKTELDGLRLRARATGLGTSPVQPFDKSKTK